MIEGKSGPEPSWIRRAWSSSPWLTAGVALLAIAVAVLLAVLVRTALAGRFASSRLSEAETLIEQADRSVSLIDKVITSEITSAQVDPASRALDKVEPAQDVLERAASIVRLASSDLPDRDQPRAQTLLSAARSRVEMMNEAPVILGATKKAAEALPKAEQGWQAVLDAEAAMDKAVAAQVKLTKPGVRESLRLNSVAATSLAQARALFVQAEDAFPEADFDSYIAYVDVLSEMNKVSAESDRAWLSNDLAKSNERVKAYNAESQKSQTMRKALPGTPAQTVANGYDDVAGVAEDKYFAAKKKALAADKELR